VASVAAFSTHSGALAERLRWFDWALGRLAPSCTGRVAALMGIGTSTPRPSPDPFQETLSPEVSEYCR
jgi:hypothetical protein